MKCAPLLLLLATAVPAQPAGAANAGADPVGFWRFEKDVNSEVKNAGSSRSRAALGGRMDEVGIRMPSKPAADCQKDRISRSSAMRDSMCSAAL